MSNSKPNSKHNYLSKTKTPNYQYVPETFLTSKLFIKPQQVCDQTHQMWVTLKLASTEDVFPIHDPMFLFYYIKIVYQSHFRQNYAKLVYVQAGMEVTFSNEKENSKKPRC